MKELLGLPEGCGGGVVTGATMANFAALAAARHALLARAGWDVENDGLFGAPPITVVVGEETHPSLIKALGMLGLGRRRVVRVPVDKQGRMRADMLPTLNDQTILCLQAGNVNTGAFDPAAAVCTAARAAGAWSHVNGAFGLWAAVSPQYSHLTRGFEQADSWATDAHKWPNIGYDCGIALVRDAQVLRAAMSIQAAYLLQGERREPANYTPESRAAHAVWSFGQGCVRWAAPAWRKLLSARRSTRSALPMDFAPPATAFSTMSSSIRSWSHSARPKKLSKPSRACSSRASVGVAQPCGKGIPRCA